MLEKGKSLLGSQGSSNSKELSLLLDFRTLFRYLSIEGVSAGVSHSPFFKYERADYKSHETDSKSILGNVSFTFVKCHDDARILQLRVNEPKAERPPHVVVARIQGMASMLERPRERS